MFYINMDSVGFKYVVIRLSKVLKYSLNIKHSLLNVIKKYILKT